MKRAVACLLVAGFVLAVAGCDAVIGFLLPSNVTVVLVNESTDYVVDATLLYHDDEDVFEAVLEQLGTERDFTLSPQETSTFTRDCDDLRAIMLDEAVLRTGLLQPDTDTGVFRMGEDFVCGDEIVLTFTHSALLIDFDVEVTAALPF